MSTGKDWYRFNQQYLMAALQTVREALEAYRKGLSENQDDDTPENPVSSYGQQESGASENGFAPAAIDTLVSIFGLSSFERKIILMCAGIELEAGFGKLIADIRGSESLVYPTFSLALAVFPDAHWSALTPDAPLRYWNLVKVNTEPTLTQSPLKIAEQILHYITGVSNLDERLAEILEPVSAGDFIVPSQAEPATAIVQACTIKNGTGKLPAIHINNGPVADKIAVAAAACEQMGRQMFVLSVLALPGTTKEAGEWVRLWNREAALHSCALFLDCSKLDTADKPRVQLVLGFIEKVQSVFIISSHQWKEAIKRDCIELAVNKPTEEEQLQLWHRHLGAEAGRMNGSLSKIVAHFNLDAKTISAASQDVFSRVKGLDDPVLLSKTLWKTCCVHTRPKVDELAQRIEPVAGWNDIILPEAQKTLLKEISLQVKHRKKVYQDWGFAAKGARGLGISALFAGESGTGKTMASEVLANELELDLYRIDLSQVVNKYIGETEKNLKQIFDAAEEGGAILLFDEADALFGKRSDVKDSHDRYSNIEVSYLLQRMEAYTGLAVLTTNLKSAIDKAFMRRIRFVVQFPYPDAVLRAEMWKRVFPSRTPVKDLDIEKLAKLSVPGGNIRNIALNAAFMAADEAVPVQMSHIYKAARSEYSKIEKAFSNTETGGWS